MKLPTNTIAATVAAVVIGGLSISPASAAPHENGRVDSGTRAGFIAKSDATYVNPRSAPEGSKPILRSPSMKSNARGRTNGRQG